MERMVGTIREKFIPIIRYTNGSKELEACNTYQEALDEIKTFISKWVATQYDDVTSATIPGKSSKYFVSASIDKRFFYVLI